MTGLYKGQSGRRKTAQTAVDVVLDVIKHSRHGIGFAEIQAKTGFGEKKIRNIIFRLNKTGKIKRKSRGIYIAV
jgi:DNA-binding transcriptional regulator PaaX